jgi:hypothetical protein
MCQNGPREGFYVEIMAWVWELSDFFVQIPTRILQPSPFRAFLWVTKSWNWIPQYSNFFTNTVDQM